MKLRRLGPVAGLGLAILLVAGTGSAVAATGGTFLLGRSNTAGAVTRLTNSNGTALSLSAPAGSAPLAVSNDTRVPRLNADLLDGLHARDLQRRVTGSCAAGTAATAVTAAGGLTCGLVETPQSGIIRFSGSAAQLQSLIDNLYQPSPNNRYVIVLAERTYFFSTPLALRPGVDLVGSVPGATVLEGLPYRTNSEPPTDGVVDLAAGSSLRDITVEAVNPTIDPAPAALVLTTQANDPTYVENVTVTAGNGQDNYGLVVNGPGRVFLRDDTFAGASTAGGPQHFIPFLAENGGSIRFAQGIVHADPYSDGDVEVLAYTGSVVDLIDSQFDALTPTAQTPGDTGTVACWENYLADSLAPLSC